MSTSIEEVKKVMYLMAEAALESVTKTGIPDGHMYMAFATAGFNMDQYISLRQFLVDNDALILKNNYITRGPKYDQVLGVIQRKAAA